jgi:hypothetical protein
VNTTQPGVTNGQCSLQEAIYATEFKSNTAIGATSPDSYYTTGCIAGTGNGDTIVLPAGAVFTFDVFWDGDAHNKFGPTATPVIFSTITIEGNGATLQWTGPGYSRLFTVATVTDADFGSGTGNLTLRNVYVKGFRIKGGDGGLIGGGGGLGAGGAIFVQGQLTVESSTFDGNGAIGGNGNHCSAGFDECFTNGPAGGGGGGFSGNGGDASTYGGGGGGGARGSGGSGGNFAQASVDGGGGGGGGTVFDGANGQGSTGGNGGFLCGGGGGDAGTDAQGAPCQGGGGGGGGGKQDCGVFSTCRGNGGTGNLGGGGGGGAGDGGNGGFGGGGGAGDCGNLTVSGGNGGFGGGGGAATSIGCGAGVTPGNGGVFGGHAAQYLGGGGGALGGAIFNFNGTVNVRNSTFANNYVTRGERGGGDAANGADAGGAIFSLDNTLEITNSTFSSNQSTGSGAAIVVYSDEGDDGGPINFSLRNSILANNGADECFLTGSGIVVAGAGNLITKNGSGLITSIGTLNPCPGVTTASDPLLQPLQLNSPGNTPTMAILNGSPAVDMADSGTSLSTDQRGVARPQVSGFDIGAYEARPPSFSLSTVRTIPVDINGTISATVTLNSLEYFNSAVMLAVSAFPSGVTVSLNPNPVTPPYNGSVSSTLKISLAPWVTPQTSTLTLSGAGGGISHSIPVSIAVQATTAGASNVVSSIQAAGCFNNRVIAPALTTELNLAQSLAGAGRIQLALGTYSAMLIEIAALKSRRLIASSCGVSGASFDPALVLTTDVRALAANLGTGGHH